MATESQGKLVMRESVLAAQTLAWDNSTAILAWEEDPWDLTLALTYAMTQILSTSFLNLDGNAL